MTRSGTFVLTLAALMASAAHIDADPPAKKPLSATVQIGTTLRAADRVLDQAEADLRAGKAEAALAPAKFALTIDRAASKVLTATYEAGRAEQRLALSELDVTKATAPPHSALSAQVKDQLSVERSRILERKLQTEEAIQKAAGAEKDALKRQLQVAEADLASVELAERLGLRNSALTITAPDSASISRELADARLRLAAEQRTIEMLRVVLLHLAERGPAELQSALHRLRAKDLAPEAEIASINVARTGLLAALNRLEKDQGSSSTPTELIREVRTLLLSTTATQAPTAAVTNTTPLRIDLANLELAWEAANERLGQARAKISDTNLTLAKQLGRCMALSEALQDRADFIALRIKRLEGQRTELVAMSGVAPSVIVELDKLVSGCRKEADSINSVRQRLIQFQTNLENRLFNHVLRAGLATHATANEHSLMEEAERLLAAPASASGP